jgi:saccharopine dehydrogenase-like NADP-dependent oxidoreductase
MITANYLSPEVAAMNDEAKRKGILMLNEMGLDPGIDHLATYRVLEHVKA